MAWASHVGHKASYLLGLREKHLVLIVDVAAEERDELCASAVLAQREGDGAKAGDRV
jgi:hypothetical protein